MRGRTIAWGVVSLSLAAPAATVAQAPDPPPDVVLGPAGRTLTMSATPESVFAGGRRLARRTPPDAVPYYDLAPRGAFLSDGSQIVVWVDERTVLMPSEPEGDDGCCTFLRVAHRARGAARFDRPRSYEVPGRRTLGVRRIVTGPGRRFALVLAGGTDGRAIRFGRGGRLGRTSDAAHSPLDVAFDRRGRAIVTHGDSSVLRTRVGGRDLAGPALPPLPDQPGRIQSAFATAPSGAQVAVSKRRIGRRLHVEMARRAPGRAFGHARTVVVLRWPDFPPANFAVSLWRGRPLVLVTATHRVRLFTPRKVADRRVQGVIGDTRLAGGTLALVEQRRRRSALRVACRPSSPLRTLAHGRSPLSIVDLRRDAVAWREGRRIRVARTGC